ncbi:efflux RND transporter periplasmic adaptor subunit [Photobacterium lutimaris]|uniref:Efflux RND transporter periplasmic adaptor subunit n=1 Tax=Photobacterium lutimaris TaxID=388278 RepID=A0A2T3IZD7_9GAMM|nr:efflux RND transporter periplasmic adaptor subunit [Photobacterium lutimaris]PSU34014.1 efflux RND transporter periplasmic adaptor subunit [Photobacterium lutimaris]TDR76353.1 RND family efflux transporter MFP subunit [Photobacterium lutimaris]
MKKITPLVLAPVAMLMLNGCSDTTTYANDKPPRPVQVIELGSQHQFNTRQFSGVLEAIDTANLAFKVPGTITEVMVKTGEQVKQGQVIARLDPHDYQVAVLELEARLDEAKAANTLADIELKRVKQATNDNAIAAVNLDRAVSGYKRSQAMVKVVEQNLQKANDALAYTQLTAPFDGVVGKRFSEQFEQAAPGLPVLTLHQPSHLQAVVDIPESLINQFREQPSGTVSWYGNTDIIPATLKEVNTLPDPIKQTYQITYQLDQSALTMITDALPGKAIQLNVAFEQGEGQYCIPYSAIIQIGATHTVFTIEDGRTFPKAVNIESLQTDQACVTGDLGAGDKIITAGVHYLRPDQPVGKLLTTTLVTPQHIHQDVLLASTPGQSKSMLSKHETR